jgi:pimeloyl-ACP methyl ester carboxylesterase
MLTDVVDSFVDVSGGSVFTRRWIPGRDDRPPILLLHDSLGCVDLWRHFPEALAGATARPVIAYDRLGFGKSAPRVERPSADFIREEAEILFPALLRGLGISRCALFGHSVGGAMAVMIAALYPETCEALITESAQAFVESRTLSGIRTAKAQFDDPARFEKIVSLHGDKARWVLDAWTEVWLSADFSAWSLNEHLPKVTCPVLAIHGDSDEFGSVEFPRRIAGNVGGPSELVILDQCGHVPHRERQADVLRLAASFLERHPARATSL